MLHTAYSLLQEEGFITTDLLTIPQSRQLKARREEAALFWQSRQNSLLLIALYGYIE